MARLVVKDNITSGGTLDVGQTLQMGGFVMAARSAATPTMTSHVISLLLPLALDTQFGTPYPRSAGFDTDIGAFIESSSMSSL